MSKFILVVLFVVVTIPVVSSSPCPDPDYQEWIGEDTKCQQQNTGHRYHCLYDIDKDMAIPLCAPAVNCTPGTHTKIDAIAKTVTCVPCSSDMYQPEAKVSYSFTQLNCGRLKQKCDNGLGELQCGEATATHNYKCRCDFSQGMKPSDINKCDCFIKDMENCQCIEANCDDGEALAANFSCVPVAVPQSTKDPIVSTQESPTGDSPSEGDIVGIVLAVFGFVAVIVVIVIYFCKKTKNSKPKTEYEVDEIMPSSTNIDDERDVARVSLLSKTGDSELYDRIKEPFVDSVDPLILLIRLQLGHNVDEREVAYTKVKGRSDGAHHLLHTVIRTHPDDWFDRIVKAMNDPNVGLEHTAEEMERIREEINDKQKQSPSD